MEITLKRQGVPAAALNVEVHSDHSGKPCSFILPGGPGSDHTTYLRYGCLADVTDLVFHDPRGCGKSSKGDPASYTMENYINDVEEIRQQLGLAKIIVIGKSYGSMCALGYALRYPKAVARLVLAAGAPSYRFLAKAKANLKRIGTPEQIRIAEKLWTGSFNSREELVEYFRLTNPLYALSAKKHPEKIDVMAKADHFSYDVLNEGFKNAFWHFDYEKELKKIACPTLVLAGRYDWINDLTLAEFMAEHIPGSELRVFEESSHAMESDMPEQYFQTIREFISG